MACRAPARGRRSRCERPTASGRRLVERSAGELVEAEDVTRSFVNRLLRLTLLAPDIVEAILDGRQPKVLQLEDLIRALPSVWAEQHSELLRGSVARQVG